MRNLCDFGNSIDIPNLLIQNNTRNRKKSLLSICRAQLILCKNNASERKESLLSICRTKLILCKGSKKLRSNWLRVDSFL